MKEKWEELLDVLHKMLNIYRIILTLSQQKKEVMVAVNIQELEKVTQQEEIFMIQIGKLEKQREKIVSEIMAGHGMTGGQISLEQLHKVATTDIVEQLEIFKKEIGIVMDEIVPLNELNMKLIKQALGFIDYNINILSQTVAENTYAPKGQAGGKARRTVFDARV